MLKHGKEIHPHCLKKDDLESDLLVNNSCRYLKVAHCKFSKIKQKDLVSWNAMLAGYALGGFREEVTNLLDEMEFQGVEPDFVTWNG